MLDIVFFGWITFCNSFIFRPEELRQGGWGEWSERWRDGVRATVFLLRTKANGQCVLLSSGGDDEDDDKGIELSQA